ncbi:hypothetical protein DYB31_011656 [Aphanomyces astaci]|uniref:Uncharacterized protein n=1 Tax=Aphanomyces astaci TaxID=112090 RepID=A0A397F964_APHAT|nr:hypothetical protein DYB31_011656 [Aphanomyces astaci]
MWNTVLGHEDDAAEEKENKAFNVIINSLDDYNIAYVCHLKLVSDVWTLLTERYESRAYADVSHVIPLHAQNVVQTWNLHAVPLD